MLDFPLAGDERRCLREVCPGLEFVSVARCLEARERESGVKALFPNDGHWTAEGHRWVAGCLADSVFPAGGAAGANDEVAGRPST
jgi:hypothetical protein